MRDLSEHILDLAMNSIKAEASLIEITIIEDQEKDVLTFKIKDNGLGMNQATVEKVLSPFYTTRTTRKVGLGLAFLSQNAELAGGKAQVTSELNKGTEVEATFQYSHIDRIPIGDLGATLVSLIMLEPNRDFLFVHQKDGQTYTLDTREIKQVLGEVPINHPDVINWIKEDLNHSF